MNSLLHVSDSDSDDEPDDEPTKTCSLNSLTQIIKNEPDETFKDEKECKKFIVYIFREIRKTINEDELDADNHAFDKALWMRIRLGLFNPNKSTREQVTDEYYKNGPIVTAKDKTSSFLCKVLYV